MDMMCIPVCVTGQLCGISFFLSPLCGNQRLYLGCQACVTEQALDIYIYIVIYILVDITNVVIYTQYVTFYKVYFFLLEFIRFFT